jgi:AcrR family transcriptional regulator
MSTTPTARKDELLDRLVTLFLAEGFHAFTLDALAQHLRCSKTTLYSLGYSKDEVILNAVKHFSRTRTEEIERRTANASDPTDRIVTYLNAVADGLRPGSKQFYTDLSAHPGTRALYELNTQAAADRIRQLVAQGVDAGAFRDVHAAFVADVAATTIARILAGEIADRVGLSVADACSELAALILGGIHSDQD